MEKTCFAACAAALVAAAVGAAEKPWFVVNEDNDHFFKLPSEEMSVKGLTDYADYVARGKVTHFVMCVSGQRTSYDSKVWEPIWAGLHERARKDTATKPDGTHDLWAVNCKILCDKGIDPYAVWIAHLRKKGVSPWLSMRMNDVHYGSDTNYFRNTTFYKTHKEWWLKNGEGDSWADWQFDYAQPEVRAYTLALVREIAERWDADGLELDWMRFGNAFRYGQERANAHLLDEFMREARRIVDAAGARRGRRMALSVRVPQTPEEAERLGFNAVRWAREGLVDVVIPDTFMELRYDLPVGKWLELLKGTKARLVPGTGSSLPGGKVKRADVPSVYRGLANHYYRQGATGVYFFNLPYFSNRKYSTDGGGDDANDVAAELYARGVDPQGVVFERDFHTTEGDPSLDGFRIVKQYDGVGKDAIRQAKGYGIAFPLRGNVHLATMSGQRDCTVECSMFCDPAFGDSVGFDVYYRYDESTRVGGVLGVTLDRKTGRAKVKSGVVRKLSYAWADEAEVEVRCDGSSGTFDWRLELDGKTARFGSAAFTVPDGVPSAGGIGFDKFQPSAPLVIGRLAVFGEAPEPSALFPVRTWRFPRTALCSMSDWRFVFAATNSGPCTVLSAAVEGGPAEAFNRKIGYTGLLPNEAMDRPWFEVVKPDGMVGPRQYLHFGRIGLREHWHHELPFMGKADIECPVRRTYALGGFPEGSRILIGFDGFASEDRRYIGSPRKMMLVDPASGATVAVGDVPDANGLAVEVDSGRDKMICGLIPKSTPDYGEALDYAVRNHFFLEDEAARFSVGVRYGTDRHAADDLTIECTLQDAFKDPMRTLKGTATSSSSAFPGEDRLTVEVEPLTLPIGVYHLGVEVKARGETLLRKSVAFEVMGKKPDAPRAQMASGIPEMMSPICDYQSESNVSDFRGMGGNDLAHYFAINGMQVLPTVEKDDWNLNRLYRRRYFGWFLHNLVPGQKPETFESRFKDIDYLCTELVAPTRLDVCSPGAYKGEVRKLLADFLRGKGVEGSELGRFAADESAEMTVPLLKELLERFGQEWMDRAADYHMERSAAAIGRWKGIRELVQYFTVPYYVWHCKGAFITKTYGVNMLRHPEKTWYTGFAILEDYPFLVGGSPLEGIYALAALKMDAPELNFAPEVKGMCAIPTDTSTVYGCPPYGVMNEEDASFKRFVDFKYTTCWYRDGGFHYWTDDRILLCNPSPSETDNVLGAWREARRHEPVRPVRTFAIVTGTKCCSRHPLKALEVASDGRSFLDVVNTAEEFPLWAALAVKGNGLPNGFLIRPEELAKLTPDDVHTLILPPLDALTEEERTVVRKLHGLGVNLVASENADGMEDVFGVRKLPAPQAIESIGGEPSLSGAAAASYAAASAETLLADDGGRTVLALKSNGEASAAFYTIAPSLYSRAYVHIFPRQSGEVLSRSAADLFRRMLPLPEMSLSEGRMSVCRDGTGGLEFCVMEDAQPKPARAIAPVLTLRGDYANAVLDSSKPCTVLRKDGECLQVAFMLAPRECVTLHVGTSIRSRR